ncbi:hypothetical protein [Candidatus Vallotia cooleyia]
MLQIGRDRLLDEGVITPTLFCNAENIPFTDDYFDIESIYSVCIT